MKTELFSCQGCGYTELRESGKRHWHDGAGSCSPSNPFYMYSVRQTKATNRLLKSFGFKELQKIIQK